MKHVNVVPWYHNFTDGNSHRLSNYQTLLLVWETYLRLCSLMIHMQIIQPDWWLYPVHDGNCSGTVHTVGGFITKAQRQVPFNTRQPCPPYLVQTNLIRTYFDQYWQLMFLTSSVSGAVVARSLYMIMTVKVFLYYRASFVDIGVRPMQTARSEYSLVLHWCWHWFVCSKYYRVS